MECTCVRQTDLPGTSKIYADLIYHFDRVQDLYPYPPNDLNSLVAAAKMDYPADRRAALVAALTPWNAGNPSLQKLAEEGTVAVVTGQQVGLFGGPAYTVYKALTAIRLAEELNRAGVAAVPMFWLATEDHDFAEVNHAFVFTQDLQHLRLETGPSPFSTPVPVGGIAPHFPLAELREALAGLPFEEEAVALAERCYAPGATMGSAFAALLRELFAPYGLLLIDPMSTALRELAAPMMAEAVLQMPELTSALIARSKHLVDRGYHAQVLVDKQTSLAFLLQNGERHVLRQVGGEFHGAGQKFTREELAANAAHLSPNALLRPVLQDYMIPTAAYVGGPAELAYFAQSQVLYQKLLGRQPVKFPRAAFTLLDERTAKRVARYQLQPAQLFETEDKLQARIAAQLIPESLRAQLETTKATAGRAIETLTAELLRFDPSLAKALGTSQRKIEHQLGKIQRKTAAQILRRDEQAGRDTAMLHNLAFPERHPQERYYSILPFYAKYGPSLIEAVHGAIRVECPDHQIITL